MFKVGADPEFMLVDSSMNLRSAIEVIEGTKHDPLRVNMGALQHDNVLAELNIDPAENEIEFLSNISTVINALRKKTKPLIPVVLSSAEFPDSELEEPEAMIFGCDPDFNAWTMSMNSVDPEAPFLPFRSAGGHIHIGYNSEESKNFLDSIPNKVLVVKMMDIILGVPSVFLDTDPSSPKRRTLYGKAGAHRPKPYGVEYRSLSSFWLTNKSVARGIFKLSVTASELSMDMGEEALTMLEANNPELVQDIINNSRKDEALKFAYDRVLPKIDNIYPGTLDLVADMESIMKEATFPMTLEDW